MTGLMVPAFIDAEALCLGLLQKAAVGRSDVMLWDVSHLLLESPQRCDDVAAK